MNLFNWANFFYLVRLFNRLFNFGVSVSFWLLDWCFFWLRNLLRALSMFAELMRALPLFMRALWYFVWFIRAQWCFSLLTKLMRAVRCCLFLWFKGFFGLLPLHIDSRPIWFLTWRDHPRRGFQLSSIDLTWRDHPWCGLQRSYVAVGRHHVLLWNHLVRWVVDRSICNVSLGLLWW